MRHNNKNLKNNFLRLSFMLPNAPVRVLQKTQDTQDSNSAIMEHRDPDANQITAFDPAQNQVWLYELKPGQKARPLQLRGGAPPTTTPKNIFAHAEQVEGKTVRLYIPRNLIGVTLAVLKPLPFYSHIIDDDIENPPTPNFVAAPGASLLLDIAIKDLLIPQTPEIASDYLSLLRPFGLAAPTQAGTSLCISYSLNVICATGDVFHDAVLMWATQRQYVVSDEVGYAHVLHKGQPKPPSTAMDARDALRDTYIALALGFKSVNETYISDWATRRIGAILATLGLPSTLNVGTLPFSTALSSFLRSQTGLLSNLVTVILANRTNESNPMLASVCNGVVLIAEYNGMTTAQSARAFFNTSQSAALALGDIFEEGEHLIAAWEDLQQIHGRRFPYARALNLPGIERLDIRTFPNLAYCAWFSRSSDPTYRNMVAPKPTLDIKLLQVHTITPISAMLGASISDRHSRWLLSRGITPELLEEISKKVQSTLPTWVAR
jgi:hypothetical protein